MLDPNRVYGWLEAGGRRRCSGKVGKARMWMTSEGFAPARSNVRPVTVTFARSGERTIDPSILAANNFYPSERYDYDSQFYGRFKAIRITASGVAMDIDKAAIADIPVYVARRSSSPQGDNPFPGVADYTEINRTGAHQTDAARAIGVIDPKINVALYNHTDIVSADDSLAGQVRPGEPGASAIADTLIDWVLERSKGRAATPTPRGAGRRDVLSGESRPLSSPPLHAWRDGDRAAAEPQPRARRARGSGSSATTCWASRAAATRRASSSSWSPTPWPKGADTLVTVGAVQSNHCRLTLAAAVREGLKCRLVLEERVPGQLRAAAPAATTSCST